MKFDHLRDCDEWRKQGLQMNTTSNEASKLFDITLSQLISWYEDEQYGGIEGSINSMLTADPNFVLGHVLKGGINLVGCSASKKEYSESMDQLLQATSHSKNNLTRRELDHVYAMQHLYNGKVDIATQYWEKILVEHPTDIMAIKFACDSYFYLGWHPQMRDCVGRIFPYWKSDLPLYGYLYGIHSFGLIQSNYFEEAKKQAIKGLEINKHDAWATHTICHYNEYTNDFKGGIKFLRDTEENWSICNLISTHNYWHLALYHIENKEHEIVLELFDKHISAYLKFNRTLDLVDLSSLLLRLQIDGCKASLKERWDILKQAFTQRIEDHGYTFNDAHILMMLVGSEDKQGQEKFFKSLEEYLSKEQKNNLILFNDDSEYNLIKINDELNYLQKINKEFANDLFNSIVYFNQGEFSKVVDLLYPIRYNIIKIGGSNAQRDIFNQLLVQSAIMSDNQFHKKIGQNLMEERISLKPKSNLNMRIKNKMHQIGEI